MSRYIRNTRREQNYQASITKILLQQGYKTFARLFNKFMLILTDDPNCIGYTRFDQAIICLNQNLNDKGFSFVARHEILHQWMDHHHRIIRHLAKQEGLDPENLTMEDVKRITMKVYWDPYRKDNKAADWEESKLYTKDDKVLTRDLSKAFAANVFNSTDVVRGLLLEDDHPEWMKLTYEEIYDKLVEEEKNMPPLPKIWNIGNGNGGYEDVSGVVGDIGDYNQDVNGGEEGKSQKGNYSDKSEDSGNSGEEGEGSESGKDSKDGKEGSFAGKCIDGEQQGNPRAGSIHPHGIIEIGDYDPEWQKKEEEARAKKVEEEIKKGKQKKMSEEDIEKERMDRVRELEKSVNDPDQNDLKSAKNDVVKKQRQEKQNDAEIRSRTNRSRYWDGDINQFKRDIESFAKNIKDEAEEHERSWKRMDRKNFNPNIMKKGIANVPSGVVPLINVYYDVSGSCQPYINRINETLEALRQLEERDHLIKLNVYYFANTLTNNPDPHVTGYGNSPEANYAIIDQIKEQGAENIIILTDSNSDYVYDGNHRISVSGNVWWLWSKGDDAPNFRDAIQQEVGRPNQYAVN